MLYLIIYILITLIAQVLIKKEALKKKDTAPNSYLLKMVQSPIVVFAYCLNLTNIFIWLLVLSELPLLIAFISTSCIYVIIIFIDYFIFNQKITALRLIGALFISAGIILSFI